jgi:kumamolisin
MLRRRAEVPSALITGPQTLSGDELAARYGADPADVELVRSTLEGLGLTVTDVHPGQRRMTVSGPVASLEAAFGTTLSLASTEHPDGSGRVTHRYRSGGLSVPAALDGVVIAVLGLDDRPAARPQFRPSDGAGPSVTPVPLTALQVATAYQFPAGTDGSGQTIAIVELGGGFRDSDLHQYFSGLGIAVPSISSVGVSGGSNSPGQDADMEVLLDIEVVGAVAPGAAQKVYFAPNSDAGFVGAISQAVHDTPTPIAVSISWGQSEDAWSAQSRVAMDQAIADAAVLGVTVTVASGDNGSADGVNDGAQHCDFPASSPHALACGGTRLEVTASGAIAAETVWNDTTAGSQGGGAGGGGYSDVFGVPSWQAAATSGARATSGHTATPETVASHTATPETATPETATPETATPETATPEEHGLLHEVLDVIHRHRHPQPAGPGGSGGSTRAGSRGVPDVAGNADPVTGYKIVANGQQTSVGGTSAVAPLWAGLIARLAQASGKRFGLLQPLIYAGVAAGTPAPGFNDVTSGNNGAYKAAPGWDPCTGLGSPNAPALLARLTRTQ